MGLRWCKKIAIFWQYMVAIWRERKKICIRKCIIFLTLWMGKSKDLGQFWANSASFFAGNTWHLFDCWCVMWFLGLYRIFGEKYFFQRSPASFSGPIVLTCKQPQQAIIQQKLSFLWQFNIVDIYHNFYAFQHIKMSK